MSSYVGGKKQRKNGGIACVPQGMSKLEESDRQLMVLRWCMEHISLVEGQYDSDSQSSTFLITVTQFASSKLDSIDLVLVVNICNP